MSLSLILNMDFGECLHKADKPNKRVYYVFHVCPCHIVLWGPSTSEGTALTSLVSPHDAWFCFITVSSRAPSRSSHFAIAHVHKSLFMSVVKFCVTHVCAAFCKELVEGVEDKLDYLGFDFFLHFNFVWAFVFFWLGLLQWLKALYLFLTQQLLLKADVHF